jgi:hypothetical protein
MILDRSQGNITILKLFNLSKSKKNRPLKVRREGHSSAVSDGWCGAALDSHGVFEVDGGKRQPYGPNPV